VKYLITGGAGFIGSHLSKSLLKNGDEVICFDNLQTGILSNFSELQDTEGFQFIEGSILNEDQLSKAVKSVDEVIHLAAAVGVFNIINNPLNSLFTNLNGTETVLRICDKFTKPMFLSSTSEIYGKNSSGKLSEDSDRIMGSPLLSRWSYAEAKAIDESMTYFYHVEKNLEIRIVRFFNVVGPGQVGDYGMVIPRLVNSALRNEPLKVYGSGEQSRSFCHVNDAIEGVIQILNSKTSIGKVYNLGNEHEVTIAKLASDILRISKSSSQIERVPYEKAYRSGFEDMNRRVPDISKIKKDFGWTPKRDLETILQDTIKFMAENIN
jgi:UDP-glucose 4-epimerase